MPPCSTLATKVPPGAQHVAGEVGSRLGKTHDAQVVSARVAGGRCRHVGQHDIGATVAQHCLQFRFGILGGEIELDASTPGSASIGR